MFREYNCLLDISTILKDAYNYTYQGDIKDLFKQDFIELEGDGVDAFFWFFYKGEKYLYKPLKEPIYNVWGEILSTYLAEFLNIPHAEYRIAKFDDKMGVVTKSFLKEKDTLIVGSELFQDFFNQYPYKKKKEDLTKNNKFAELYEIPTGFKDLIPYDKKRYLFNYLNNIDSIWSMISTINYLNKEEKEHIINGLCTTLIFDIISMQYDRHPNNWGIIENKHYSFSPLYDNATSFGLNYNDMRERIIQFRSALTNKRFSYYLNNTEDYDEYINRIVYQNAPTLVVSTEDSIDPLKKIKKSIPEVLTHYLEHSSTEIRESTAEMILSVNSDLIEEFIKQAEIDNHMEMDENLYVYILNLFDIHLDIIHNIAMKYRRVQNVSK